MVRRSVLLAKDPPTNIFKKSPRKIATSARSVISVNFLGIILVFDYVTGTCTGFLSESNRTRDLLVKLRLHQNYLSICLV